MKSIVEKLLNDTIFLASYNEMNANYTVQYNKVLSNCILGFTHKKQNIRTALFSNAQMKGLIPGSFLHSTKINKHGMIIDINISIILWRQDWNVMIQCHWTNAFNSTSVIKHAWERKMSSRWLSRLLQGVSLTFPSNVLTSSTTVSIYNESPEKRERLNPSSRGENAFSCFGLDGGEKEPLLARLLPSLPKLGVGDSLGVVGNTSSTK